MIRENISRVKKTDSAAFQDGIHEGEIELIVDGGLLGQSSPKIAMHVGNDSANHYF